MSLLTAAAVVGTGLQVAGTIKAGSDAKKAAKVNSQIALADAQHRKEVAVYNAMILQEQAVRLRNEQVARINEVTGLNIDRLNYSLDVTASRALESFDMNVDRINRNVMQSTGRIADTSGMQVDRISEEASINSERLRESAGINIGRIRESTDANVGRLNRQADQTQVVSNEQQNAIRRMGAEVASSQRAFYGARGVMIDTGTPASMQIDTARLTEVDALRTRRNYRLQIEEIQQSAADLQREASYQVDDIKRSTSQQLSDIARVSKYQIGDINRVTAYQIEDITENADYALTDMARDLGYQLEDAEYTTTTQIEDIIRNTGYDLSDVEFEASKLDQQAALIMLEGDAALAAGNNRASAYKQAGADAFANSILTGVGQAASGVNPSWFAKDSVAATPINSVGPMASGYKFYGT